MNETTDLLAAGLKCAERLLRQTPRERHELISAYIDEWVARAERAERAAGMRWHAQMSAQGSTEARGV